MRARSFALIFAACSFLASCSESPEKSFGIAVLNCNLMHGFAGETQFRELESPSVKMVGNDINKTEQMKRREVIESKIVTLSDIYEKVKQLKQDDDNKAMIGASLALYEYVLPVYKSEYMQLAALFDEGGSAEAIDSLAQSISDKYHPRFLELYNKVAEAGKPFAQKHNINVNWDVRTSPR